MPWDEFDIKYAGLFWGQFAEHVQGVCENYKVAIGEPLTQLCASAILIKPKRLTMIKNV